MSDESPADRSGAQRAPASRPCPECGEPRMLGDDHWCFGAARAAAQEFLD